MRSLLDRWLDWLCQRLGLCIRFDGDLMAPSGDEPWWPAAPATEQETRARALATYLLDDGGDAWPAAEIYALLQADGWAWNGRHWVEADHALA